MSFDPAPSRWHNDEEHKRLLAKTINGVLDGKINSVGSVTLTVSATSTTVTNRLCSSGSFIDIMPTTANAATAKASVYNVPTNGSFVILHASSANADQTFKYVILG